MNSPMCLRRGVNPAKNGDSLCKRPSFSSDCSSVRNKREMELVSPSSLECSKSNFPQQESSSHSDHNDYQDERGGRRRECPAATSICRTFLWLYILCFVVTSRGLAAEPYVPPASCKYPDPVEFALVKPLSSSRGGFYPNGSKAQVDCYSNFRVKSNDDSLICVNGEWIGANGRAVECELMHSIGATRCGASPDVLHGYYDYPPEDRQSGNSPGTKENGYPVGTELVAECVSTYFVNCSHPHRNHCGRISCQADERWAPKDGVLVTACVAKPVTLTVNGDDDRLGTKSSSSLKNYLVLALVLVCIFVVGALTVALLRRPLFCKKREQNQGDGPVVIGGTSSSPNHQAYGSDLDSLPVAMNTGIFLPGQGYDLQDCQIQDVPFVGTTVFK